MPRDQWPPSALRALWEPLRDLAEQRLQEPPARVALVQPGRLLPPARDRLPARRDPDQGPLAGLPPGGAGTRKDVQCWAEWWVLWRRVAAGLSRRTTRRSIAGSPRSCSPPRAAVPSKKAGRPKPEPHELAEMWRCAASLERLAPESKESLGDVPGQGARPGPPAPGYVLWCLGRLGRGSRSTARRTPWSARDAAERWIDVLLDRAYAPGRETADAVFALAQLARVSGDRARDFPTTASRSGSSPASSSSAPTRRPPPGPRVPRARSAQQGLALGDALPVGLRLRPEETPLPAAAPPAS